MLTVSTYEGKHCLLTIKKNGKTAASLKDNQVSVKTVCSWVLSVFLRVVSWRRGRGEDGPC